ncbi:MAG: ribosome biogenesis GTP-binding protein YihA/YsxC [Bacteroidota bacterium]|nr:ribosome biogenesis GTP-binding protein YihA/YsxC [Bacteroidota bacterium]
MNQAELKYVVAAVEGNKKYSFPKIEEPLVVFIGRSNVGKSSLINSILKVKIARTSNEPGKTRQINYYLINNEFYFVDLPGYGYAKVSGKESDEWKNMMDSFFNSELNIKLGILIIDARREPLDSDKIMNEYLNSLKIPYFLILNKIDKLTQNERAKQIKTYQMLMGKFCQELLPYSALIGKGSNELSGKIQNQLKNSSI